MAWKDDKRSRHQRGYGSAWEKLREQAFRRDAGICQYCRAKFGLVHLGTQVDHIVPKAQGGSDEIENLQTICDEGHKRKTAEENGKTWRPEIGADGWPILTRGA